MLRSAPPPEKLGKTRSAFFGLVPWLAPDEVDAAAIC
jgi:hypothetical protein